MNLKQSERLFYTAAYILLTAIIIVIALTVRSCRHNINLENEYKRTEIEEIK